MADYRIMKNGFCIVQKEDLEKVKEKGGKPVEVYCDIVDGKVYFVLKDSLSEIEKVKIDLKMGKQ